jgi:hypothetical protein
LKSGNYQLLLSTPNGTVVTITTAQGTVRGALAFQPLRGTGRLYDVDLEVVYEFAVDEITEIHA